MCWVPWMAYLTNPKLSRWVQAILASMRISPDSPAPTYVLAETYAVLLWQASWKHQGYWLSVTSSLITAKGALPLEFVYLLLTHICIEGPYASSSLIFFIYQTDTCPPERGYVAWKQVANVNIHTQPANALVSTWTPSTLHQTWLYMGFKLLLCSHISPKAQRHWSIGAHKQTPSGSSEHRAVVCT